MEYVKPVNDIRSQINQIRFAKSNEAKQRTRNIKMRPIPSVKKAIVEKTSEEDIVEQRERETTPRSLSMLQQKQEYLQKQNKP
jgi:hypothetical protein